MTTEEAAPRPPREERPRQRRYGNRRKVCRICYKGGCTGDEYKVDYKDVNRLRQFISDRGKIDPRRKTGCCASHQRKVAIAVKRARKMALLPYTIGHVQESGIYDLRG